MQRTHPTRTALYTAAMPRYPRSCITTISRVRHSEPRAPLGAAHLSPLSHGGQGLFIRCNLCAPLRRVWLDFSELYVNDEV